MARYYRADLGGNLAASTEITGYTASAFAYLHKRTNERLYLDCAVAAASALCANTFVGIRAAAPTHPNTASS